MSYAFLEGESKDRAEKSSKLASFKLLANGYHFLTFLGGELSLFVGTNL
jgi:hypothetical protein